MVIAEAVALAMVMGVMEMALGVMAVQGGENP